MYARKVSIRLNPNSAAEGSSPRTVRIPQVAISLWDRKESADAYSRETYPQVLKGFAKVIDGTPEVQVYEVVSSTLHETAAHS